ncbi:PREDICTED: protein NETWORKED 1A-like [Erythranthe guttata]|uniref:protein NETWORKED 1A-like n=1 Tax=Erythranthe guttata TaxID=4155 RepID=UPI00064DB084|nr:PREDICTED: protein NETWORKED 1A-like [Erythranthe guttata]|eukprot:XP_012848284.1 PREDICTED: protein NETWORKED 1A-like [Erythranthe guttata]
MKRVQIPSQELDESEVEVGEERKEEAVNPLCKIEGEINEAQEKSGRAEIEAQALKEALIQLEAEKNAGLVKQKEYLERISDLEAMVSKFQEDTKGLDEKALEAESESRTLKDQMSRLELEKETVMQQYKQCLEKISELKNKISIIENEASLLKKRAERAEAEVSEPKRAFADLNKEKEASALHLNDKVSIGNVKLKTTEEKCALFEESNQSLRVEADNLAKKIAAKDQELSKKQGELESLEVRLKDEHLRHEKVEATLETLRNSHSKSRDDQMALTLELKNVVQKLKETEASKNCLEEEIRQVRDENDSLSQTNSSTDSMQNEIFSSRKIKERLEKEVSHHIGITISLQREISNLKEEIEGLNRHYRDLVEQVEEAGLDPTNVLISIKCLHEENSKLRRLCEKGRNEKAIMSKKLENIEDALLESGQFIYGEKTALVAEKASILSQLQAMTENMQSLVGRNAVLEDSLSTAKIELEDLREKSKGLEEICKLLKNERSRLLTERGSLPDTSKGREDAAVLEAEFGSLCVKQADLQKTYNALQAVYSKVNQENTYLLKKFSDPKDEKYELDRCNEDAILEFLSSANVSEVLRSSRREKIEEVKLLLADLNRQNEVNVSLEKEMSVLIGKPELQKAENLALKDAVLSLEIEIIILRSTARLLEESSDSMLVKNQKLLHESFLSEMMILQLEKKSSEQQLELNSLSDQTSYLRARFFDY